jgi:hypothetical protein
VVGGRGCFCSIDVSRQGAGDDSDSELELGAADVALEHMSHEWGKGKGRGKGKPAGNPVPPPAAPEPGPPEPVDLGVSTRVGNKFYRGGHYMGRISYLLQWDPISIAAFCCRHDDCNITGPLGELQEGDVSNWLFDGGSYASSAEHVAARPAGAFNKRKRR